MPEDGQSDGSSIRGSDPVEGELLDDLCQRAKTLLSEMETLRLRLRDLRQEGVVELAHFRGTVRSELTMLEKLSAKLDTTGANHVARSSNVPFLETVWTAAKGSRDLIALQKRIILDSGTRSASQGMKHVTLSPTHRRKPGSRDKVVLVDVIADGGRTWSKCSLITNTRLLFDLAKLGWVSDGSDDSDECLGGYDAHANENAIDEDDEDDVPLLKTAKELARAAKLFRVRTRHPSIQLILPRIHPGQTDAVDRVLEACRRTGVVLVCGDAVPSAPHLEQALLSIAPDPFDSFSETVNIDCTILLALVSDFSHAKISKEPWFHKALQRQVEIEGNENLLPSLLYPAMRDRKLVCTRIAVDRMREIVDTIGTPSERARTRLLLGDEVSKSREDLINEMQLWSAYTVPRCWQLPVRVMHSGEHDCTPLSTEALHVSEEMTAINKSVFRYGWAQDITTITSNRTIVKQIENGLNEFSDLDDGVWPRLYLCPTARSLVGKEKRGAKTQDHEYKSGAWPLPDPLRREEQRRNGLDVLSRREGHEVEDLRPAGYPCEEVLEAKHAAYPPGAVQGVRAE